LSFSNVIIIFVYSSFIYRVGIESIKGESTNAYLAATQTSKPTPAPIKEEPMAITPTAPSDTDSDSN
jgi:stonin-1/2